MDIQATEVETDAIRLFGLDVLAQGLRYLSGGHVTKKAWTIAAVTWRSIPMTSIDYPVTNCGLCGQKSLASKRQLRLVVTFSRSAFPTQGKSAIRVAFPNRSPGSWTVCLTRCSEAIEPRCLRL